MNRRIFLVLFLTIGILWLAAGLSLAQGSDPTIDWWAIAGGGGPASGSGGVTLNDTVGQPFIGPAVGISGALNAGYWYGAGVLLAANDGPSVLGTATAFTATIYSSESYTFTWDLGDGSPPFTPINSIDSNSSVISHTYPAVGVYTATVTATNNLITTSEKTVVDILLPPVEATNDGPTLEQQPTTLTATLVTGANITYQWNLGDGSTAVGRVITHTYPAPGSYTVVVTVENSLERKTASTVVQVDGFKLDQDGPKYPGETITFSASHTSQHPLWYQWNFGDGSVMQEGSDWTVLHSYGKVGSYTVRVTATGSLYTATTMVSIVKAPPPVGGLSVSLADDGVAGSGLFWLAPVLPLVVAAALWGRRFRREMRKKRLNRRLR